MTADCHLHTCLSDDSDTPPEDMAERAIALGMKSICITDHYDMDFPGGEYVLDTEKYQAELARLTAGAQITPAALESAGELLDAAQRYKKESR